MSGHREKSSEGLHFRFQAFYPRGNGLILQQKGAVVGQFFGLSLGVFGNVRSSVEEIGHLGKVFLFEAPRSQRRGAESDAAGIESALVLGRGVLVKSDGAELADAFQAGSVQSFVFQVNQDQMIVCSAGNEVKLQFEESFGEGLCVS